MMFMYIGLEDINGKIIFFYSDEHYMGYGPHLDFGSKRPLDL